MEMLEMNICIKHVGARDIYYQVYDVNYLMEMLEMNISNMLELEKYITRFMMEMNRWKCW